MCSITFRIHPKNPLPALGKYAVTPLVVIEGDVGNSSLVMDIFSNYDVNSVLHFSGLKSVEESMADPLKYYIENVDPLYPFCEQCKQRAFIQSFSPISNCLRSLKAKCLTQKILLQIP